MNTAHYTTSRHIFRGIGLEFVKQLLEKGCSVVATVRSSPAPEPLLSMQADAGDRLHILNMDVGDEASVVAAASSLKGSAPLTHIIHNAGIYGPTVSLDGKSRLGRPAGGSWCLLEVVPWPS